MRIEESTNYRAVGTPGGPWVAPPPQILEGIVATTFPSKGLGLFSPSTPLPLRFLNLPTALQK